MDGDRNTEPRSKTFSNPNALDLQRNDANSAPGRDSHTELVPLVVLT